MIIFEILYFSTKSNVPSANGQTGDDSERLGDGSDVESQNKETENLSIILLEDETLIEENETQEIRATVTQVNEMDKAYVVPVEITASSKRSTQSETRGRLNSKKARTQLSHIDKGRSERLSLLRDIAQRTTQSMPQSVEDPVDLFFKSLAATAKTLSPRYLAEAKRKLFLVMADIEEKNIEEKYPSNPSPLPALLPTPSPSLSISHSDDTTSAFHAIGQAEYGHSGPSYYKPGQIECGYPDTSYNNESEQRECGHHETSNNSSTDQEPMVPSDSTIKSYLTSYNPLNMLP